MFSPLSLLIKISLSDRVINFSNIFLNNSVLLITGSKTADLQLQVFVSNWGLTSSIWHIHTQILQSPDTVHKTSSQFFIVFLKSQSF